VGPRAGLDGTENLAPTGIRSPERPALGGLVVSVLATGPKVRGFDPDRWRWIFKGDKNPEHHFLRRGSKAVGPMS
jgi:hypothetical protein